MNSQKKLDDFTRNLDLAKWYMGISAQQEDTMFTMPERLRDDFEQGTGEKMFKMLIALGLQPVISKKKISRIVQLSRNNILAFLYFVMEGYYKTKQKDGVYSINEQLLMNAIAKIDMLPTIRALDNVLPRPPVKIPDPQSQSFASLTLTERPPKKPSKKSPYFLKQPRPVPRISRLTAKIPDFVVSFSFWPIDGPPDYGKDDEEPWYAAYRLNPGQRLIKKTLSETLERYFKLAVVEGKQEEDQEDTPQSREPEANMCLVHKGQVLEAQLLRDELAVKARDRCLELLDVNEPYAKLRKARIVAQLEHDIDVIMARHRNAMHCDQTKVLTIENFGCVLCQKMLVSQPWPEPKDQVGRALVGEDCVLAHTAALDTYRGKRLEGGAEQRNNKDNTVVHTAPIDTGRKKGKKGNGVKQQNKDGTVAQTAATDTCRGKRLESGADKLKIRTLDQSATIGKRLEGGGGKPKKNDKKGKKEKKAKVAPPEPEPPKPVKVTPYKPPPRKLFSPPFRMHNVDFEENSPVCKPVIGPVECEVPPAPKKSAVSFLLAKGKLEAKAHKCDMRMPTNRQVKPKFFRGPRSNQPYQFKYHRVFQCGQPKPFDLAHIVTKSFVKALDKSDEEEVDEVDLKNLLTEMVIEDEAPPDTKSEGNPEAETEKQPILDTQPQLEIFNDLELNKMPDSRETLDRSSNHSGRSHMNYKAEIVDAVVRCAKAVWQKRTLIKRAEMERMGRLTPRKAMAHRDTQSFDPNDDAQMDQLLKDGMRVLRKEPRYVLACLPDAHKLPVLREWIKRRYGKTYSQKELEDNLTESNRIFELVTILQNNCTSPDLMGIDRMPRSKENFNYYKQVKTTAALAKQAYHDQLNASYLANMSSAWYAMGNYLVPGGPPRRTFFAYIASNPQEIMRNKMWNGEFRNYRSMRDKRKEQERLLGKKD